jgi:hypothetical protein
MKAEAGPLLFFGPFFCSIVRSHADTSGSLQAHYDTMREHAFGALDRRYRLVTAHSTLFRFTEPVRDAARLAALLHTLRDEPLGVMRIAKAELVVNDWSMSSQSLVQAAALPLRA